MKRGGPRKAAGLGLASVAIASPAIAQSTPSLRRRPTTSFPKNLDTLYDVCEMSSNALFAEVAAKNHMFRKLNDSMTAFSNGQYQRHQVCERPATPI